MTQQEHLQLIRAKCVELLELAKQRTPGAWRRELRECGFEGTVWCETNHKYRIISRGRLNPDGDSAFIASAAGPFEAALASTVAAIDWLHTMDLHPVRPVDQHHRSGLAFSIITSWPLELLQP